MKTHIQKTIAFILVILITACSPTTSFTKSKNTSPSSAPSKTTGPTLTATITDTPVPSPTPTDIPEEEKKEILQSYKVLLFVQVNVNMLDQTAMRVNSGELTGLDSFASLIAVAALVNAVEEAIPQTSVPEIVQPYWDKAIPIHESSKILISKWFNDEIISTDVLEETPPLLKDIEKIMDNLEKDLASVYGIDAQELNKTREEAIQSIDEIFATSTPMP